MHYYFKKEAGPGWPIRGKHVDALPTSGVWQVLWEDAGGIIMCNAGFLTMLMCL